MLSGARRPRVFSIVVAAAALAVLVAAVAWRANTSRSSSAGAGGCGDDLGGPSALVSFDDRTGVVRWSRRVGERSAVALVGGVVAGVDRDGRAIGVDSNTGAVKWCRDVGAMPPNYQPAFVAAGDLVVTLAANGRVLALDPANGATRWDTTVGTADGYSLVGGPVVYVLGVPTAPTFMSAPSAPASGESGTPPTPASMPATPPAGPAQVVLAALDASNGRVVADAPPPPSTTPSSDAGELVASPVVDRSLTRQDLSVALRDPATGADRWSKVVPGYTATIIGERVLVIDQTGGTGDTAGFSSDPPQVQTVLSSYDARTGEAQWHVALPGVPQQPFDVQGHVVIANGPQVFTLDPATGATQWTADHGSPGVNDRESEPGEYSWFAPSGDGAAIVGLIRAQEPYHD